MLLRSRMEQFDLEVFEIEAMVRIDRSRASRLEPPRESRHGLSPDTRCCRLGAFSGGVASQENLSLSNFLLVPTFGRHRRSRVWRASSEAGGQRITSLVRQRDTRPGPLPLHHPMATPQVKQMEVDQPSSSLPFWGSRNLRGKLFSR
jgi:hypothetical protein